MKHWNVFRPRRPAKRKAVVEKTDLETKKAITPKKELRPMSIRGMWRKEERKMSVKARLAFSTDSKRRAQ
jgi:hypothetical protein